MVAAIVSIIPLGGSLVCEPFKGRQSCAARRKCSSASRTGYRGVELYSGFKGLTKMFHRFRDPKKSGFQGFEIPQEPNPIP